METMCTQEINVLRAILALLEQKTAPTSIGYNDMALMIAYGKSLEYGCHAVNPSMISGFLLRHSAVPDNIKMHPKLVRGYLEELADARLIEREITPGDYRMSEDTSSCLVDASEYIKSSHIDDFLFHSFRVYCAREMRKQM
jgi:hypothetical protein